MLSEYTLVARAMPDEHHLTYERFGAEVPGDLMVVCRHHHVWIHKQEKMTSGDASLPKTKTEASHER